LCSYAVNVQRYAAGALRSLTEDAEHLKAIVEAEAIPVLERLLREGTHDVAISGLAQSLGIDTQTTEENANGALGN
jgi:hypothetical protein